MADATTVDKYAKATNTKADVQKIQQQHLADGAKAAFWTKATRPIGF
jgi:hypothetical protein